MNPSTFVVTPSLFRALLFGSLILGLVGAVIDVLVPGLVPEILWQAQAEAAGEEIRLADYVLMVAGVVLLVAAVVSVYGLYMFRRWAPLFSLLVTVATVPLYPSANGRFDQFGLGCGAYGSLDDALGCGAGVCVCGSVQGSVWWAGAVIGIWTGAPMSPPSFRRNDGGGLATVRPAARIN
jgi:Na+-translocating ferredoxin:NAD+ oxidoreductase RnfE subunit